jgi:hypothetical protein
MARIALNPETINSQTTRTPTFTAAIADGHMAANDGLTVIRVKNTDAAPITVTVLIPATLAGIAAANGGRQHTVGATTGDVTIGPFPDAYTQSSDRRVWWNYSATTGVTVAVLQVEKGV